MRRSDKKKFYRAWREIEKLGPLPPLSDRFYYPSRELNPGEAVFHGLDDTGKECEEFVNRGPDGAWRGDVKFKEVWHMQMASLREND